jgi:myo-inositol-1(or 4)-monophosphatase
MNVALEARAEFAGRLAREAGALAGRYFLGELAFESESKGERQDWVSAADHAVEQHIRDAIARQYPGDSMLGEEAGGDVSDRVWVVDPIDGTLNFVHGMRYWCVSIAYVERGVRQVGAIYDPSQDELFSAAKGMGARCNGAPISVSTCASLDHALISQGYVHRHDLDTHLALCPVLRAAHASMARVGRIAPGRGSRRTRRPLPRSSGPHGRWRRARRRAGVVRCNGGTGPA